MLIKIIENPIMDRSYRNRSSLIEMIFFVNNRTSIIPTITTIKIRMELHTLGLK